MARSDLETHDQNAVRRGLGLEDGRLAREQQDDGIDMKDCSVLRETGRVIIGRSDLVTC
jgi:hypothetical protein